MAIHSGLIDEGSKIQILPSTRKIVVPSGHEVIGVVGDHNSEQLTLKCPKTIDGHDVVNCSAHYISWANANRTGKVNLVDIQTDDEYMYMTWDIDANITSVAGNISFAVHFMDVGDAGVILYKWSTTVCTDLRVLDTVAHDTDDESEDIILAIDIDAELLDSAIQSSVGGVLNNG